MQRLNELRGFAACAAAIATILGASALARAETVGTPVKATWQVQDIHLSYLGFTNLYSCDGMRDKVANWIKAIGAHPNSKVTIAGCDRPSGPAHLPSVRIILATPMEANSAAANAKDDKRAQALAQLQRGKEPFQDGTFDAVRKTVTLLSKEPSTAGSAGSAGDCELLENFRDQVLKKIDAKIVKDNLGCTPHQGTVGNPSLTVEVLTKA